MSSLEVLQELKSWQYINAHFNYKTELNNFTDLLTNQQSKKNQVNYPSSIFYMKSDQMLF